MLVIWKWPSRFGSSAKRNILYTSVSCEKWQWGTICRNWLKYCFIILLLDWLNLHQSSIVAISSGEKKPNTVLYITYIIHRGDHWSNKPKTKKQVDLGVCQVWEERNNCYGQRRFQKQISYTHGPDQDTSLSRDRVSGYELLSQFIKGQSKSLYYSCLVGGWRKNAWR